MDYNNFIGTLAEFMNAVISEVQSAVSYTDTRIGTLTGFVTTNVSQTDAWQTKNILPLSSYLRLGSSTYRWDGYFGTISILSLRASSGTFSSLYASDLIITSRATFYSSVTFSSWATGSFSGFHTGSFSGNLSGRAQYVSATSITQQFNGYLPILSGSSIVYTMFMPVQYFSSRAFDLDDRSNVQFQGDINEAYAYVIGDLVFCYCKATIANWQLFSSEGYINVVVDSALRPAHARYYSGPQYINSSQMITTSGRILSYKVHSLTDASFTFSFSVCYTRNGSLATYKW